VRGMPRLSVRWSVDVAAARRATLVPLQNSRHHVPMPDLPAECDIEPAEAARGLGPSAGTSSHKKELS
jgi:hypothetical protein